MPPQQRSEQQSFEVEHVPPFGCHVALHKPSTQKPPQHWQGPVHGVPAAWQQWLNGAVMQSGRTGC
jgi:hypothetical protein